MKTTITKKEYTYALLALSTAIILQLVSVMLNKHIANVAQYAIVVIETVMAILIWLSSSQPDLQRHIVHRTASTVLLFTLSAANIASLLLVLRSLMISHVAVSGLQLLSSAIAIFLTNIIIYSFWYWEIDSPGFTQRAWTKNDKDFQFTQQDMADEFPGWQPQFSDYLYLSVTNAVNFAPADTRPLSREAKLLMGSQALISVFTLALVLARSVSILGT